MPLFGGKRGGKSRLDGLVPGSPEAKEADRKANRERMRRKRAEEKAAKEPPPIPSMAPPPGEPLPRRPREAGPLGGDPFLDAGDSTSPVVAWSGETLKPLFEELIEAAETGRVESFVKKCTDGGLMPKLVKEIEADCHWPKSAKAILKRSLPRLSAKWLNKTGISAEYEDELSAVTALLLIVQNDRKLSAKLDQLIAAQQPTAHSKKEKGVAGAPAS